MLTWLVQIRKLAVTTRPFFANQTNQITSKRGLAPQTSHNTTCVNKCSCNIKHTQAMELLSHQFKSMTYHWVNDRNIITSLHSNNLSNRTSTSREQSHKDTRDTGTDSFFLTGYISWQCLIKITIMRTAPTDRVTVNLSHLVSLDGKQ